MIWNKLLGEFIDIIEWTDDSNDTLVYRFERYGNEIKNGAKLTVREGQTAIFVNEGELADVFAPGMYTLETQNLPILSTLQGWKYGFNSPFKAEIYFVSTRRFTDLKWGTKNPIMLRDPEFGPVRLRAFGTYTMQADDAPNLIREIVGTDGHFTINEITNQLRNLIVSRFASIVGGSRIPVLDLAANYDELSTFVADRIRPEFQAYGLDIPTLLIENISLPPAVEEALDKRTSMGVIGDLSKYTQFQTAEAITKAADNPGGMAAGGMGMGMGFAMANQMGQAMAVQPQAQTAPAGGPPPLPQQPSYYIAVNGQQAGPFDMNGLRGEKQAGRLSQDTLVWAQGMAGWTKAAEVAALGALFQGGPPPLPPGV